MRVMVVGATGTIGRAVVSKLSARHEIIKVGHTSGDYRVDIASADSLHKLYEAIGPVDAVVSASGVAKFADLDRLIDEDFQLSLSNKLMGQVNLVRLGIRHVRDRGSFTVTSGLLGREPMRGSAAISLVNAGLDGFVRAAALELPRGIRINAVSPVWVTETLNAMGMDTSHGMPAEQVAWTYVESVEGKRSGEILDTRSFAK
ncbi:MAG TPA: short chain dehydrogenase [Nitrospiraceae bacterium]|nr:short chain dehydrogenase [Nitrospiraceae bacterium]